MDKYRKWEKFLVIACAIYLWIIARRRRLIETHPLLLWIIVLYDPLSLLAIELGWTQLLTFMAIS